MRAAFFFYSIKGIVNYKKKEAFQLPNSVEYPNKLSNRFIADLQKIHDYIEYFHLSDNFFSKWT